MSSINTTFQPLTLTTSVGLTATQIGGMTPTGGTCQQAGVTTFRIRNVNAAVVVLGWGQTAASAVAVAPSAGVSVNAMTLPIAGWVYLDLPPNTFFIGSVALACEITGGQGGGGG